MLTAHDLMSSRLMTVSPDMSLRELVDYLRENGIHGALVKEADRLVGVVSYTDVVVHLSDAELHPDSSFAVLTGDEDDWNTEFSAQLDSATVDTVMTPAVFTCDTNSTAGEVADLMLKKQIHRMVVTENSQAIGLISSTDLLRAVVEYEADALPCANE